MKTLLPTLREKKRYIAIEVMAESAVNMKEAQLEIMHAITASLGTVTSAKAGIQFLDMKNNKGIIRVNQNYADDVKAACIFINNIKGKKTVIKTISVSGILNKTRKKMEA